MTTTQATETHPGRLSGETVTIHTTNGGVATGRAWTHGPTYNMEFQGLRADGTPRSDYTTIPPHRILSVDVLPTEGEEVDVTLAGTVQGGVFIGRDDWQTTVDIDGHIMAVDNEKVRAR